LLESEAIEQFLEYKYLVILSILRIYNSFLDANT